MSAAQPPANAKPCLRCRASGTIVNPLIEDWYRASRYPATNPPPEVPTEVTCPLCRGDGWVLRPADDSPQVAAIWGLLCLLGSRGAP